MGKLLEQFDALTKMPNGTNEGPASPARRQADAKRASTGAMMRAIIVEVERQADAQAQFGEAMRLYVQAHADTHNDPKPAPATGDNKRASTLRVAAPGRRVPTPQPRKQ